MLSGEAENRLNAILRDYGGVLRGMIAARCRSNPDLSPDDLLQDARLRLWRALLNKGEIRCVSCYLHRLAAAVTIDAVRRANARHENDFWFRNESETGREQARAGPQFLDPGLSPEAAFEHAELIAKAQVALGKLPANRRQAVALHLQGFSTAEIAARTGWHEAKARNLVYRGLTELRNLYRTS